tara:strand:+ start:380 stop:1012 length:633 start_codon:yes stop_codon:yes gene_type:complete
MRVLELFKGSGSIGKHYEGTDIEVISLDFEKKYEPTICCDIMDWNYKEYPTDHFDIIWASPECKIFSMLQNCRIGTHKNASWKNKEELKEQRDIHSKFIKKTIEIIKYFNPTFYYIENPLHSKIWDYVEEDYKDKFVIVDYCYYGYRYKKPTKILTNKKLENKRCTCKKHDMRIGVVSGKMENGNVNKKDNTNLLERYSIPPLLLKYLLD